MVKNVFAEHSLTHGQETGEAGWASDGGGGAAFPSHTRVSLTAPSVRPPGSATHNPGQDRTPGRLCTTTPFLPGLSVSSAVPGAAGGGRPSGVARPPTRPGQQPLRLLSQGLRATERLWGQSPLPPHCNAEA